MTIKEVIALHFSDPESKARFAKLQTAMDAMKQSLSADEYCQWLMTGFWDDDPSETVLI